MDNELTRTQLPLVDKGAVLLSLILRDNGHSPLRELAESLHIPLSTAYRLVAAYKRFGFLNTVARGRYAAGFGLLNDVAGIDRHAALARAAQPHLAQLARKLRQTTHLGILENDMVTYLLKEQGGGTTLFTRVNMQLEAYCSAIGKVLLASLPDFVREAYIEAGPFVPLTSQTVTDAVTLREMLADIKNFDFAIDNEEVAEGLWCIAVPIRDRRHTAIAAISASRILGNDGPPEPATSLTALRNCADHIVKSLYA